MAEEVVEHVLEAPTPASTLGVRPDASAQEAKKAYLKRALKCHPDKTKHPEAQQAFVKLTEVHEKWASLTEYERCAPFDVEVGAGSPPFEKNWKTKARAQQASPWAAALFGAMFVESMRQGNPFGLVADGLGFLGAAGATDAFADRIADASLQGERVSSAELARRREEVREQVKDIASAVGTGARFAAAATAVSRALDQNRPGGQRIDSLFAALRHGVLAVNEMAREQAPTRRG